MRVYKIKDAYIRNEHVDDYYNNHYIYNVELEDEYPQHNKHDIHYVISQDNSFNVTRQGR